MKLSPLQLERYFIKELHFLLKDDFESKPETDLVSELPDLLNLTVRAMRHEADPLRWSFEVSVQFKDDPRFPYNLRIVMLGFFKVSNEYPAENVEMLARVNGPALLYSAAREAVVTITSRSGSPTAALLPSVSFLPSPPARPETKAKPTRTPKRGQPKKKKATTKK
jgi:preprotein translocase subunit SecB